MAESQRPTANSVNTTSTTRCRKINPSDHREGLHNRGDVQADIKQTRDSPVWKQSPLTIETLEIGKWLKEVRKAQSFAIVAIVEMEIVAHAENGSRWPGGAEERRLQTLVVAVAEGD